MAGKQQKKKIILLISSERSDAEALSLRLGRKGAEVCIVASFEEAIKSLSDQPSSHIMIDVTFTPFEKAKFLKSLKQIAVISPRVKMTSFSDIVGKGKANEKLFVQSKAQQAEESSEQTFKNSNGKRKEESLEYFDKEVDNFLEGDEFDISNNFEDLYEYPIKSFVTIGQVSLEVEFLEMTGTGIIVLCANQVTPGETIDVKVENFLNRKDSVMEFTTKVVECDKDDEGYFLELGTDAKYKKHWDQMYDDYIEKQTKVSAFMQRAKY
ncbi:MAG: hypothetical protein ACI9QD_001087 [Thermoproteota archaeon]|jgi:hypothetical protein